MKKYLLAAAILATSVMAQAAPFAGPWVEAHAGYDNVKTIIDGYSGNKGGFTYGGAVGFDFAAASNVVAGVQVGINGSTVKTCDAGDCLKAGRDLEALARLGYVVENTGLVYVLGGYANARATLDLSGSALGSYSQDYSGFRIGAGYEQAINKHAFAKVEYRYSSFGHQVIDGYDTSVKRHQVLFGMGYRF
jgi:outer membrane immunogenic protein